MMDGVRHQNHLSYRVPRGPKLRRVLVGILGVAFAINLAVIVGLQARPAPAAESEQPTVREFELTASEFDHEVTPGTIVRAWGYNGQVSGPEIRVTEGDLVRVTLTNELPVGTTIHWHGVNLEPAMDGPAGLNQAPVEPGEEFVYEFIAEPAGSRWYHSHADPDLQVPFGLYGPLIIEPREPRQTYDQEFTYILGEWDLELTPAVVAGAAPRGPRDQMLRGGELGTDLFLMNGHAHGGIEPVTLGEGERVLIRLMNAGHLPHAIHSHGHSFKIVATDGNPVPEGMELVKDTVMVGPGERYDIELYGDNPGVWMFHCHMEHHMANGMMTLIQYEGEVPTGPVGEHFDTGAPHGDHTAPDVPEVTPETPEPTASVSDPEPSTETGSVENENGDVMVTVVDNRLQPANIEIPAGTTVTWVNQGMNWHTLSSRDAGLSSPRLGRGDTYSFRFDEPGEYRYICKQHALQGMSGRVIVT